MVERVGRRSHPSSALKVISAVGAAVCMTGFAIPVAQKIGDYKSAISVLPASRPGNPVHFLAFSDGGANLLVGTHAGKFQSWSIHNQKLIREISLGREGRGYALGPGNTLYTLQSDGKVAVRGLADGGVRSIIDSRHRAVAIRGSADRLFLAVSDETGVRVLDASLKEALYIPGASSPFFAETSGHLAVFESGNVSIYDRKTWARTKALKDVGGSLLAISPKGDRVAVFSESEQAVSVLDVRTGRVVNSFKEIWARCLATFSPDGKRVVLGISPDQVRVFEIASGKQIKTFYGHELGSNYPVNAVAVSKDGKRVAATYWEGAVVVYAL